MLTPHLRRGDTSPFLATGHRSGPERRRPLLHLLHGRQHRSSGLGGTRISAIGGSRFSSTKDGAHDAGFSTHDSQSFLAGSLHRGQWPAAGPQLAHGGPDRGKKRRGRRRRGRPWRRGAAAHRERPRKGKEEVRHRQAGAPKYLYISWKIDNLSIFKAHLTQLSTANMFNILIVLTQHFLNRFNILRSKC